MALGPSHGGMEKEDSSTVRLDKMVMSNWDQGTQQADEAWHVL
jgi:hypothetical protein